MPDQYLLSRLRLLCKVLVLLPLAVVVAQSDTEAPDGYRLDHYDAMVPEWLEGATVVDEVGVQALQQAGAILIDVIPEVRPPATLPANQLWLPPPHLSLPGALWLPDIGYGELPERTRRYFIEQVHNATAGDKNHPLIFFCRDNCWMSWNAARRALELGFGTVYWYPEGTDGWFAAGLELVPVDVAPGER